MNEDVELIFEMSRERMVKAIEHLDNELMRIRAGKANVHILDGIVVDYYGTPTPLNQVSNISTPDAKTIAIQPWEKTMIDPIEKALMVSNVGITPSNNGEIIRLIVPQLTEERRKELVKQVKKITEEYRVAIRNSRRDAIDSLKKQKNDKEITEDELFRFQEDAQSETDRFIKQIDELMAEKEKEVMEV